MTVGPDVFVWVWLPGQSEPVVAGRIVATGSAFGFVYGRSYLARSDAVSLYLPELPLVRGHIDPPSGMAIAGCLRDAGPDYWGRRVVFHRVAGRVTSTSDLEQVDLLTYFLESGSNRFGAIDFQSSASDHEARASSAPLPQLLMAAELIEQGETLPAELEAAITFDTGALGGARPKAAVADEGREYVAKFPSRADVGPVIRAEAAALSLARRVGLRTPDFKVVEVAGREVLLVDRFDRQPGGVRRFAVSALTLLGLDELGFRYASYAALADVVRRRFVDPAETLSELFMRIVVNVCVGNTDDHARNHAALWDGTNLELAPVFDLEMRMAVNNDGHGQFDQAMPYGRGGERVSRLVDVIGAAQLFGLTEGEARGVVEHAVSTIAREWPAAADEAGMTQGDRDRLWGTLVLRPFALAGL